MHKTAGMTKSSILFESLRAVHMFTLVLDAVTETTIMTAFDNECQSRLHNLSGTYPKADTMDSMMRDKRQTGRHMPGGAFLVER